MINYFYLIRPKQWFKNSFVIAPLIFSGSISLENAVISLLGLIAFILSSSIVYIFNDINDLNYDKSHPKKRNRPLAAGIISIRDAFIFMILLVLILLIFLNLNKFSLNSNLILALYILINIFYSLKLKDIPLLELAILSSGFVLRLLFGALILSIQLSPWIIICSGVLSLMISVGKRRNDLENNASKSEDMRKSLFGYNLDYLDHLNNILAGITIMSYLLYCLSDYALKTLGPKIENHELFPEKTNVTFAQVDDKSNITVTVWERGAGLTKACGTAACATAVAATIKKITDNKVNIKFKEGNLNIKIDKDLNIFMRGPVSDIKYTKLEI